MDVAVRLLELVEQHDSVGGVAQRARDEAGLARPLQSCRHAEQTVGGIALAELGHLEDVQVLVAAVEFLRHHLGEIRLANARRPGEAHDGDGFSLAPGGEALTQASRQRVDDFVLTDDARLEVAGELALVDHGGRLRLRLAALLTEAAVEEVQDGGRKRRPWYGTKQMRRRLRR